MISRTILFLLLLAQACSASIVTVSAETKRSCTPFGCNVSRFSGSGVLVGRENGRAIVVSAAHIFDGGYDSVTVYGRPATMVALDREQDICVMTVDAPWKATELGDDPERDEPLTLCGYPASTNGQYATRGCRAISTDEATSAAESGFSGGPLVNASGQVAGICWGCTVDKQRRTLFTPSSKVKSFVKSKVRMRGQATPQPPAEKPAPKPPVNPVTPPSPDTKPVDPLAAINARFDQLDAKIAGIQAMKGDKGDKGEPGKDADPKTLATMQQQIATLQSQVNALTQPAPAPPVAQIDPDQMLSMQQSISKMQSATLPVQVLDSNGKVLSSDNVKLFGDQPIRLRLVPKPHATGNQ